MLPKRSPLIQELNRTHAGVDKGCTLAQALKAFPTAIQPHKEVQAILDNMLSNITCIKDLSHWIVRFYSFSAVSKYRNIEAAKALHDLPNFVPLLHYFNSHDATAGSLFRLTKNSHRAAKLMGHNAFLHFCRKTGIYPKKFWNLVQFTRELNLCSYNPHLIKAYDRFQKELLTGIIKANQINLDNIRKDIMKDLMSLRSTTNFLLIRYTVLLMYAILIRSAHLHFNTHLSKYNRLFLPLPQLRARLIQCSGFRALPLQPH